MDAVERNGIIAAMYGFTFSSTLDRFRSLHSEIIEEFQCIEYDMRRIYSSMINEDYDDVMEEMSDKNWGVILNRLRKLDNSDGNPYFSSDEYELLDDIRTLRNYWCHQCYLDFVYIQDSWKREEKLQKLIRRLENELNRVRKLQERIQASFLRDFV